MCEEALGALRKHIVALKHAGAITADLAIPDPTSSKLLAEAAFERWLKDAKVVFVSDKVELEPILDDYFEKRPPFSEKKKSEFPDAIVAAALKEWCREKRQTLYLVTSDSDLQACCSEEGPIFFLRSVAEVISHAAASIEFGNEFLAAMKKSDPIFEELGDSVLTVDVTVEGGYNGDARVRAKGYINEVVGLTVLSASIEDVTGAMVQAFVEFEAEVDLALDVDEDGVEYSETEGRPGRQFRTHAYPSFVVTAEVIADFDEDAKAITAVHSVSLLEGNIEVPWTKIESWVTR